MIGKIKKFINSNINGRDAIFLPIAFVIFTLLRFPSIFEPYWYGDEGIYEVIGIALRQGHVLYSQIWDNKPPFLYLIYALFNGDQFYVRLASLIFGMMSVVVFFCLAKNLFKNYLSVIVSTLFFVVFFGLPVIEGNIANAENFTVLPVLGAFYILFCLKSKDITKPTVVAGLLLSFAFLIKIVALFDFVSFAIILFGLRFFDTVSFKKKDLTREVKTAFLALGQEGILVISFVVPIVITAVYFVLNSAFFDFFKASVSQNIGYVGYGNYFLFPMGFLILKLSLLILAVIISFRFRKTLTRAGFIIFVWTAISLFDTFFSNRPYTHYLLVLLPSFSLLFGFVFEHKKLLKITIPALIIVYLIVNSTFSFYKRNISYYQNFVNYIAGGSIEKYQNFFDPHTPRDYHVADFIKVKTDKNDNVFLWGDSAQIYALSGKLPPGRYIVSYHITFYPDAIAETKAALEKAAPKYIIQTTYTPQISNFLDNYEMKYKIDDATIYERKI